MPSPSELRPFTVDRDEHQLTLKRDGVVVGYLDWRIGDRLIHIDFVHVDPPLRGHGLGARLVDAAANHARETGRRLVPICGYAAWVLRSDAKFSDVFEGP